MFVAADQEYRSEYALPMLAKVMAKHHGFHCTVLFSLNDTDEVDPTLKIRWGDKAVPPRGFDSKKLKVVPQKPSYFK